MTRFMKITVIGDGGMATACSQVLDHQGCAVTMWSPFPEHLAELARTRRNDRYLDGAPIPAGMVLEPDAKAALAGAQLILSTTPTQFLRPVWAQLAPVAPRDVPVCSVTKGIENDTLLRPTQIVREALGEVPIAVLSGPSIAVELAHRLPATVVVASDDLGLAQRIQTTFSTDWLRCYTNQDVVGVELAGATKNVIALAAGIMDGLKLGDNAKAALLTRGLVEITRLGLAMGARPETFVGLAGLGDLVTTCISPHGRNRTAGQRIGQGETVEQVQGSTHSVIEGIATTRSLVQLAKQIGVDMPITFSAYAVLFENLPPKQAIAELMTRKLKSERVPLP